MPLSSKDGFFVLGKNKDEINTYLHKQRWVSLPPHLQYWNSKFREKKMFSNGRSEMVEGMKNKENGKSVCKPILSFELNKDGTKIEDSSSI